MNEEYLAGFFDGEGSLIIRFIPDKRYRSGFQVNININITQKNLEILEKIKQYLKMGYISYHKRDKLWHYNIYKKQDIMKFIELIRGRVFVKNKRLAHFEQCVKMTLDKKHLNYESVEKMKMMWLIPDTARNTP